MAQVVHSQSRSQFQPQSQPQSQPRSRSTEPRSPSRDETGAVSAEYAVVTAAGVGVAGILVKLLTSEWGQQLLKTLLEFFLGQVGLTGL